jgi:uncharacterized membrane protein (DUF2068 family)/Fe2+ transport system protein FeoA
MYNASPKAGLRMMALIEGAKGMLVLAAGLGLFALAHRDLQSMAEQLVRHLHLNPARHLPRIFLHLAANLSDRRLWLFASAAIIYSTISFVEAYGLWHDWKWMKWFAVLSGGIYIPAELGELLYHFSWAKLILFGVNAFVVAFILLQVAFARGRNIRNQAKPSSEVNSPPDPFTRRSQGGQQWSQIGGAGGTKTSKTPARPNQVKPQCETCPLNRVQAGVAVRIKKLCASPETQIRLRELGLGEEQILRLLTTQTNYICLVCNTRLALSRKLAELILVEPLQAFGPEPNGA